jgi:hypothetical protein
MTDWWSEEATSWWNDGMQEWTDGYPKQWGAFSTLAMAMRLMCPCHGQRSRGTWLAKAHTRCRPAPHPGRCSRKHHAR